MNSPSFRHRLGQMFLWPVHAFLYPPTTPWRPIGFYGPLTLAVIVWNLASEPPLGFGTIVGLLCAGVLVWTLIEYVLHRYAFHRPYRPFPLRAVRKLHGEHHQDPSDPAHIFTRLVFTLPSSLILWGLFRCVLPSWTVAALPTIGVALGYVGYEVIHYSIHRWPRFWLLRGIARHHLAHHYQDPTRCFGVTSPLWDVVFRTGTRAKKRIKETAI